MSRIPASSRQNADTRVQANENTVISLTAYPRRQVKDEDYTDIKQPIGQLHFARQIIHKWIGVLPDDEFKFVFFIYGKTTSWGYKDARFTYRLFTNGDREGKHASRGLGKTARALRTTLGKLENKGVLRVNREEEHTKGMLISINYDWTPAENAAPPAAKVKPGAKSLSHDGTPPEVDFHTPRKLTAIPPGSALPDIKARPLKQDFFEHDSSSHCAASRLAEGGSGLDLDIASGGEESEPPARPQDFPSATPAPASVEEKKLTLKPGAIEASFRAAFLESWADFPGAICPKWTKADHGRVKHKFLASWNGTADGAHALVAWSVINWASAMVGEFGWMNRTKPPEFPELKFFLRNWDAFARAFGRDHTETWLRSIKDHEKREYQRLTRKEGMTPEEARMRIAEGRTALKLRDEISKEKKLALQTFRTGQLMEKEAAKKMEEVRRLGLQPPHPDSPRTREAKRLADLELFKAEREKYGYKPLADGEVPDFSSIPTWEQLNP